MRGVANLPAMLKGRFSHRGSPELEGTLRRMAVVFRFLGWIWMLLLVIVTLRQDDLPERLWIVFRQSGQESEGPVHRRDGGLDPSGVGFIRHSLFRHCLAPPHMAARTRSE